MRIYKIISWRGTAIFIVHFWADARTCVAGENGKNEDK